MERGMAADIGCSVPGMGGYNGGRPGAFSNGRVLTAATKCGASQGG